MNPMVRASLQRIENSIGTLKTGIETLQEQLAHQSEAREKALKEYWNKTKEVSILKEEQGKYRELQVESEHLRGVHGELEARLEQVLTCTKSLIHEFHP